MQALSCKICRNMRTYLIFGVFMPSFDIVSEISEIELRNAVDNANREVASRFDFRNVIAIIELNELQVTLKSESDFQVRQLEEILRNNCVRRGVSTSGVDIEDKPIHSGRTFFLTMTFKQGIEKPTAKEIIKQLKDSKIKVQASIQGDKIRVTGKKRDELQESIAFLKKAAIDLPLQFNNFRE
jgi:uncharacterized protein YajQ (UPF0234 family)